MFLMDVQRGQGIEVLPSVKLTRPVVAKVTFMRKKMKIFVYNFISVFKNYL